MIPGDLRSHQDVLRPEYIREYEASHTDIYHRLIHINTSIEILEIIASFPLKHLLSPQDPFFTILYWNFTYTCVVMLHAILEGSEPCGILPFKNRLLHDWLPEHEQSALRSRLHATRFTNEMKRKERRAADMRNKIIAHKDPQTVTGFVKVPGLTIGDLRLLYSETEALFAVCCFRTEYATSLYPGGTVGGEPVERDIERFMKLLVRDSYWLMEPEETGSLWLEFRKRMSQADLDKLNRWRLKLGLAEA